MKLHTQWRKGHAPPKLAMAVMRFGFASNTPLLSSRIRAFTRLLDSGLVCGMTCRDQY